MFCNKKGGQNSYKEEHIQDLQANFFILVARAIELLSTLLHTWLARITKCIPSN